MNKLEAEAILSSGLSLEELEELHLEKIFELKSFLTKWVPFSKVLNSKIKFYSRYFNAIEVLGYHATKEPKEYQIELRISNPYDTWNSFQELRLMLKKELQNADTFGELIAIAKHELSLYRSYAECYPQVAVSYDEVRASKEYDPMELVAAFKGIDPELFFWQDLLDLSYDNVLLLELKRLNLWLEIENGDT